MSLRPTGDVEHQNKSMARLAARARSEQVPTRELSTFIEIVGRAMASEWHNLTSEIAGGTIVDLVGDQRNTCPKR
jgi:hypothetical protein